MVSTDDTQIPVQTGATTTPVSTDFDLGLDTPATPEVADFSLETPISAETDTPASVSDDFSLDLGSDAFAPATPLAEETTLLPDTSEPTLDFSEQPIEQPSSEPVVPLSEPVVNEETSNDFSFDLGADAFAPATPLDEETTPLQEEPVKQPEPALDFSEPAGSEETSNDFSFDLGADAFAPATPLTEPTLNLSEPVAEIAEPSIEQPLEESTSGLFTPIEGTDTPSIPNSLENPESFAPISSPDTPPVDFSEVTSDETATPSSDYQPTPDAFSQTVEALNTAKAEGTTFMSSEDLPSSTPETSSPEEEKVLNLDQMVAKFNGEDIPADPIDDPFAPMKKALEDEERKELEEKGVDANGVPLVLSPEAEEKVPVATPDISAVDTDTTSAPAEIADPIASEEETIPEPQPEQQETPEVSSEPAGTLSLDDIIDTGTIAIPQESQPAVEVSTKMDLSGILEKLKKNPMILAGAGSIVILIFVLVTMFPSGSNNPAETTIPEITQPQIPDPDHNSAIETPNNSWGISLLPDPSEETTLPTQEPEDEFPFVDPESSSTDPQPWDGFDEPEDITPTAEVSSQEMAQNLMSQFNIALQLVEVGEKEDDAYLVKYAGYIVYQSDLLIKRLENGETLDIDYYTMISNRMNTFLSQMQAYLNGEFDPNLPQNQQTPTDPEQEKQQLQDFVYSQNGVY